MTGRPDLPAALLDRARAYAAGDVGDVAAPRDAATIALLRDGADGLEVYLLRRVGSMAFAAGMHVFPGGTVDPRDADAGLPWAGPDDEAWGRALVAAPPSARALVCAAVRETFEESGVLLAGLSPDEVVADTTGDDWETERAALVDRTLSFADLVRRRGLVVRSDLLRAWSHWVTPEFEPRRYDTRFFVAALPAGQRTRDVGGEADRVAWVPARLAVQRYAAGEMAMLPPTAATLRELAAHDRVADALAAERVIAPITPRPVVEGSDVQLVVDVGGRTVPADQATGDLFR